MLEHIGRCQAQPAAEQKTGFGQLTERGFEIGSASDVMDQLIAELTPEHGADLRHLFGSGPEPVETRDQGGMQGRRNGERWRRACREDGERIPVVGAFENRLGQLLNEQRHAVSAISDLGDDLMGQRFAAGDLSY